MKNTSHGLLRKPEAAGRRYLPSARLGPWLPGNMVGLQGSRERELPPESYTAHVCHAVPASVAVISIVANYQGTKPTICRHPDSEDLILRSIYSKAVLSAPWLPTVIYSPLFSYWKNSHPFKYSSQNFHLGQEPSSESTW